MSQPQYTTQQFQTPIRQDQYVPETMQLASPASFTPSNTMHSFAQQMHHHHQQQQQQQQQRRRRQNSDVTDDMDLA
jgi:hypothetical protein